jgi:hypothetical protein
MVDDRRRYQRIPVSWPVCVWVDEGVIIGRADDASEYGLCLALTPTSAVKLGKSYRVDVVASEADSFSVVAEVRHVADQKIGLQVESPLPLSTSLSR